MDRYLRVTSSTNGDTWSNPTSVPDGGPAKDGPTLAVFGHRLHCAFTDYETYKPVHAWFDGTTWSPATPIPTQDLSTLTPALAVFNGRLYCFYRVVSQLGTVF